MALTIVHPHAKDTVPQDFTVFGLYEYPNDLVGFLFRVLPKPALHFGTLTSVKPGTWNLTFHLGEGPFGNYMLAVVDPIKGAAQYVPITVTKLKRLTSSRLRVSYPLASGNFHSDDTAFGFAPVAAGTPDPVVAAVVIYNDQTQSPAGTVVDAPTAANSYYWSIQFSALATNNNPVTLHVTSTQHPPADVGNITVIPDNMVPKKKAVKKKAVAKK